MIRAYTVEELKGLIANVHDSASKIMSLADYCKAVVVGCNKFKVKNGLSANPIDEDYFEELKYEPFDIYDDLKDLIMDIKAIDGCIEQVLSSPISMANRIVENNLANSDSGVDLMRGVEDAKETINGMVESIMKNLENSRGIKEISPTYIQDMADCVENILEYTKEKLLGVGDSAKKIAVVEEKYFD